MTIELANAGANQALFDLSERVALVTGAASGIGLATARMLAHAGADIACGWYSGDPHNVDETLEAVERQGRRAIGIEADVSAPDSGEVLVRATRKEFSRLDIVVANAGIARIAPFVDLTEERWRQVIEVNLGGTYRCFRAALPTMAAAGWGRLLATSSTTGALQGWPNHVHYAVSKAGIVGLVRALAVEVGLSGVTVNAVAPGVIETHQSADPINSLGPDGLAANHRLVPLGRNGTADEIAAVFAFLASPAASYLTGQTLIVDGGASLFEGPADPARGDHPRSSSDGEG
ncbi:MAG: SDR family NAD(P)-dependent oxidoreductase [bacterium]